MIAFSEVQASLSLFAEAIAGHPVAFDVLDDGMECWPRLAEPRRHRTNGASELLVPLQLDSRDAYRSIVLHEVLAGHEPVPEEIRGSRDPLLLRLDTLVEDHRICEFTRRQFPGAIANLTELLRQALDEAADVDRASGAAREVGDVGEIAARVLKSIRLYTLGAAPAVLVRRAPAIDRRLIGAVLSLVDGLSQPAATRKQSLVVAQRIRELIAAAILDGTSLDDLIGEATPTEDEPSLPTEGTTGVSLDGGTPTEFADSDGLAGGELLSDGDDQNPIDIVPSEEQQPRIGLQLPTMPGSGATTAERRTFVYDEWDYHHQQFRPAWCRVIEERLVGDDHNFITDVRRRHQSLRSAIRRSFMRLRPQDLVRVYRSDDGDELDLDAVIEAMGDRRSGAPADDRLHIRRDRAARDVATAFLVDLSASTSSPAVPPEPDPTPVPDTDPMDDPMSYGPLWHTPPDAEPIRRVIDVARDAVALMGDALHELGDRYAIYGFSGTGRDNVEFKIGKDFDDRVSANSWANISAMKPLRYTRMGPAVRHATAKLAGQAARTRVLIVVSDGYPQDSDYGRDRHDRDYGVHDTGKALIAAAELGIETFCVTIDPAGHDYLRTMCAPDRYLVIEDVESLPAELASLYLNRVQI